MKRFICVIFVLLMAVSVSFASSSVGKSMNKKFIVMSDDEILEMYDLIMKQFERRGLSPYSTETGVTVPAGVYTIGTDIPQGSYRIKFPDDDLDYGNILLFGSDGERIRVYSVGRLNNVPEIGKIDLVNGMIFELDSTSSVFFTYKGLFGERNE